MSCLCGADDCERCYPSCKRLHECYICNNEYYEHKMNKKIGDESPTSEPVWICEECDYKIYTKEIWWPFKSHTDIPGEVRDEFDEYLEGYKVNQREW